jgi:hypothetical protein
LIETLDSLGNWTYYGRDDNGDGTGQSGEVFQTRTHNAANEITDVTEYLFSSIPGSRGGFTPSYRASYC